MKRKQEFVTINLYTCNISPRHYSTSTDVTEGRYGKDRRTGRDRTAAKNAVLSPSFASLIGSALLLFPLFRFILPRVPLFITARKFIGMRPDFAKQLRASAISR